MKFFFLAGEASGDLHASNLAKSLQEIEQNVVLKAWGGDKLEKAGVTVSRHYRDLALMGFVEIITKLPAIFRNLRLACQEIIDFRADAVVLVDFSGFNLRLAKRLRKAGFKGKIFYYISPKLWVWNSKRVNSIKKYIDAVFCILPFEVDFYKEHGYDNAYYIGNPLMDEIEAYNENEDFLADHLLEKPIIALLPGSRANEIKSVFPRMLQVVTDFPQYQFVVAGVQSVQKLIERELQKAAIDIPIIYDETYDIVSHAQLALVTSGTATLETAILNTPLILCYSGNPISFAIAKSVVNIEYIGLPNLIVKREMVIELIQSSLNKSNLLQQMKLLLSDESIRTQFFNDANDLRDKVGNAGASKKSADLMVKLLKD